MNPVQVVADLGVDTRLPFLSTAITPGNNTLEFSIADHRATRVQLGNNDKIFKLGYTLRKNGIQDFLP